MPFDTQLCQLIAAGDLDQALELLLAHTEGTTRYVPAVQLAARFNILKHKELNGLISFENAQIERNKITDAVLALLEGRSVGGEGNHKNILPNTKLTCSVIIGLAATLIAILGGVAKFSGYSLPDLFGGGTNGKTTAVTVFVHGPRDCADLIMRENGFVIMRIKSTGETKKEAITDKGEAKFSGLRVGEKVQVDIDFSEPYRAVKPDSIYTVSADSSICLEVRLENLDRVFGKVIAHDQPLPGVIVSIGANIRDTTDDLGNYEINIPGEQQRKEQEVSFFKPGFKLVTKRAFPQTEEPLNVIMEK